MFGTQFPDLDLSPWRRCSTLGFGDGSQTLLWGGGGKNITHRHTCSANFPINRKGRNTSVRSSLPTRSSTVQTEALEQIDVCLICDIYSSYCRLVWEPYSINLRGLHVSVVLRRSWATPRMTEDLDGYCRWIAIRPDIWAVAPLSRSDQFYCIP